jgi:hypothetical protein
MNESLQLGVMQFGCCLTVAGLAGKVAQVNDEFGLPSRHFVHKRLKVFFIARCSPAQKMAIRGYAKSNGSMSAGRILAGVQGSLDQKTSQKEHRRCRQYKPNDRRLSHSRLLPRNVGQVCNQLI